MEDEAIGSVTGISRLDLADEPDWWLGGAIFLLLEQVQSWVHRRVESVAFMDAGSMRRRVSVDFEVPGKDLSPGGAPPILPLALLAKRPLVNFDLRDESGRAVPLLTRQENAFVAWCALARIALHEVESEFGLRRQVPGQILDELKVVAGGSVGEAHAAMSRLAESDDHREVRMVLTESEFFMSLAWTLSQGFLLLTPIEAPAGTRRVLKFSYAQELDALVPSPSERVLASLGVTATGLNFELPAAGEAEAYHFEFAASEGVEIAAAELVFLDEDEGDETAEDEGTDEVSAVPEARRAETAGGFAHFYFSGQPASSTAVARVWIRPPTEGLLRAAVLSSALTALVFLFFLWDDRIIQVPNEPDALLLAIPGIIAALIVRPGEHGLASHLLAGIRWATAVSGVAAYSGALVVIGPMNRTALVAVWRILAMIAVVCFIALLVMLLGRRPTGLISEVDELG